MILTRCSICLLYTSDYTSLKETTYGPDGLRSILLQKNATAVNKVRALKEQKLDLKISDEEYKKQVSEIKRLMNTPCEDDMLKCAFIFCCLVGLDVYKRQGLLRMRGISSAG